MFFVNMGDIDVGEWEELRPVVRDYSLLFIRRGPSELYG
jgi:hypothetical protein